MADYLRLSNDTIYRMANTGTIPASNVRNHWRFRKDDVDAWLKKNKNVVSDKDSNGDEGR